MSLSACRALVFLFVLSAGGISGAGQTEPVTPTTGQCSIQPTYVGCQTCCDISNSLGEILTPLCSGATKGGGALAGGWIGAIAGGLIGDLMCEPMMQDADCYDRCEGKDGDPSPIECFDPGDVDDFGVCRQICEQGQHNIGPMGCPTGGPIALTCCVNEYDPPDDDCPDELCPGPLCPPECDDLLP